MVYRPRIDPAHLRWWSQDWACGHSPSSYLYSSMLLVLYSHSYCHNPSLSPRTAHICLWRPSDKSAAGEVPAAVANRGVSPQAMPGVPVLATVHRVHHIHTACALASYCMVYRPRPLAVMVLGLGVWAQSIILPVFINASRVVFSLVLSQPIPFPPHCTHLLVAALR